MQWIMDLFCCYSLQIAWYVEKTFLAPRCSLFQMRIPICPKRVLGQEHNPVSQDILGKGAGRAGTSLFRFEKGSAYQVLIHELKYRGNRKAGLCLGRFAWT